MKHDIEKLKKDALECLELSKSHKNSHISAELIRFNATVKRYTTNKDIVILVLER
jgi:hypothetical protein